MEKRHRSAASATSSRGAFTNTPVSSARRWSCAPIASASSTSQARGLPRQRIIPSAQAPRAAACWASSSIVRPQIFTRVMARLWSQTRGLTQRGLTPSWSLREQPAAAALVAGRGAVRVGRPLRELDGNGLLVLPAVVLDLDLVAGLVCGDGVGHVVLVLHLLAVDRDDQVAARCHAV